MWLLPIHRSLHPSPVLLLVAIAGIMCVQRTMFRTLIPFKALAAGGFFTCINFKTASKLPKFLGIVGTARAKHYSTKAPSRFRSLILNSRCTSLGRCPFSVPKDLPRCHFTHTPSLQRLPLRPLWLPLHVHIGNMGSRSKPLTWTVIPWSILSFDGCSRSSNIYVLLELLGLINSLVPFNIATRCNVCCKLWSNALECLIIASACSPSQQF